MTDKRCFRCEILRDEQRFQHGHFDDICKDCYDTGIGNDEMRRFRSCFEETLFYLRYPSASPDDFLNSNERKKNALAVVKQNVEYALKILRIEEKSSSDWRVRRDIDQRELQLAQVVQLESKFNN